MGFFRHIKNNEGIDFLANRNLIPGRTGFRQRREREDDTGASDNETYGLSPTFLAQLNIKPPLVNRVFVTNVSFLSFFSIYLSLMHYFSFLDSLQLWRRKAL
jgi:hypothetical protein